MHQDSRHGCRHTWLLPCSMTSACTAACPAPSRQHSFPKAMQMRPPLRSGERRACPPPACLPRPPLAHTQDRAARSCRGVYAVGFIARPVGALLFGHVGDTAGRRSGLLWSTAAMAVPTVLIGCLPTYAMVGNWAPALLAILRAMQGLALGGEYGTAQVGGGRQPRTHGWPLRTVSNRSAWVGPRSNSNRAGIRSPLPSSASSSLPQPTRPRAPPPQPRRPT